MFVPGSQVKQRFITVFLHQVAVGDFILRDSSVVHPPPKDPSRPFDEFYDSCVDDVINPSIFVTFDRCQSYPEYIVEYWLSISGSMFTTWIVVDRTRIHSFNVLLRPFQTFNTMNLRLVSLTEPIVQFTRYDRKLKHSGGRRKAVLYSWTLPIHTHI